MTLTHTSGMPISIGLFCSLVGLFCLIIGLFWHLRIPQVLLNPHAHIKKVCSQIEFVGHEQTACMYINIVCICIINSDTTNKSVHTHSQWAQYGPRTNSVHVYTHSVYTHYTFWHNNATNKSVHTHSQWAQYGPRTNSVHVYTHSVYTHYTFW